MINLTTKEETHVPISQDQLVSDCLQLYLKAKDNEEKHILGMANGLLDKLATKII